ncbi:hypothetical protein NQ317_008648 [Molorchus minor]|uniref:Uncharacterized protein n=1 Tax=Molorchus minor TaxID=1323400 RepID=A0ABQ9K053_9CUCU|nr:hypothetical protein NQ317_008648 [Molorchus minor]
MNKFYEIKEVSLDIKFCGHKNGSSIRGDLNFIKKLDYGVKKENENSRTKVCTHPKPRHQHIGDNDTRFSSHPKRIFSDTDASVFDSSPRRVNLSSSESNINLGNNEGLFYQFYEEKVPIVYFQVEFKNIRKKLHKKLTQTKEDSSFHIEMCIGDSSSVSPRSARGKRSVIFEDECLQSHIEPPKEVKGKPKHRSVTTIPSKRVVPSNSAPVNNAYNKSVISDSVFEKKFKMFVEKSLHTITDIRSMLETGITPPDGDEDITRRTVRVREFSNRFSRNYLYPLSRQLEDLNKMAADDLNANHKFLTAYQIVLNGLQTYLNHLPSSIGSCSSDKLKLLLKHLLEICCMHNKTIKQPDENGLTDFIDTFKLNAELTLQKVEDHFSAVTTDTDSILKSTVTKVSLQRGASKATLKSAPKKKKIEKRLSMYSVPASFRKDANWKKAVEGLAKKKLNVKSRYKTAAFVHRPPREKETPQVMPFPSHCKLFCKKSSSMLKNSPTITSVDEDAIMTMVQMEDKKERGGDSCDEPPNDGEPKGIVLFKND